MYISKLGFLKLNFISRLGRGRNYLAIQNRSNKGGGALPPFIFLFFCCLSLVSFTVYGKVTLIKDILSSPEAFDGEYVEIEGEVIGEMLKGNEGGWINILGHSGSIGIFLSDINVGEKISYWGDYRAKGDWLRIEGIFNKNCPLHHISDIHLENLEVIKEGAINEDFVPPFKINMAIISSIMCLTIGVMYLIKVKYGTKT